MSPKISATFKELEVEIEYEYTPEEKEVWTLSNGDPGYPGYPATVDIIDVYHGGLSIMAFIGEMYLEKEMEYLVWKHLSKEEPDYER